MSSMQKAKQRMESALESLRREFGGVRTGKASPALLDTVRVEAYGSRVPLNQVGTVSAPEPRMLTIQPWDRSLMKDIERALRESDLGVNPNSDGSTIRLNLPQLTEERRKDYIRLARGKAEDGRISVRNIRRRAKEELDRIVKDGEAGEDEVTRAEKELEKTTAQYVSSVDELLRHKEAELLEV